MTIPEVSIIVPTYNVEDFIVESINSVIFQEFTDWEVIVIDDGSNDLTKQILLDNFASNPKIRLYFNERNLGSGYCRNFGIENSLGRFIAFLDADDIWHKSKLSYQLSFMKLRKASISHTSYSYIDTHGNILSAKSRVSSSVALLDNLRRTEIGTSTAIIDTSIVGRDFRFSSLRARQDLVLWYDLMKLGHSSLGLDKALVMYRVRPGSISSNKFNMLWVTFLVYINFTDLNLYTRFSCYLSYVFNAINKRL